MTPFFPDCYDEWELDRVHRKDGWVHYETLFEGTREECLKYAYENLSYSERMGTILMDWEGREWDV